MDLKEARRRMPRYRRPRFDRCIFCGAPADSLEHLFPDGLRKALPEGPGDFVDFSFHDYKPGGHVGRGNGGLNSMKLPCACTPCNNNWMSDMQTGTKPLLMKLAVQGDWPPLSAADRWQLARWITMTVMVQEYGHQESAAVSKGELASFYSTHEPLPNWLMWIGRRRYGDHERFAFHGGHRERPDTPFHSQVTVLGVGHLVVACFSSDRRPPFDALWVAQRLRLRTLWPRADPLLDLAPPGWTLRRGEMACVQFTELMRSRGPKRLAYFLRAGNLVRHDPTAGF